MSEAFQRGPIGQWMISGGLPSGIKCSVYPRRLSAMETPCSHTAHVYPIFCCPSPGHPFFLAFLRVAFQDPDPQGADGFRCKAKEMSQQTDDGIAFVGVHWLKVEA